MCWYLPALRGGEGGERGSGIWRVCCVIRCSNKVYQCWTHRGQVFTASLNTQCHFVSPERRWKCFCLSSLHLPLLCSCPCFRRLSESLSLYFLFLWLSLLPSLASFCSRLFSFFCVTSCLCSSLSLCHSSLGLCVQTSVAVSDRSSAAA